MNRTLSIVLAAFVLSMSNGSAQSALPKVTGDAARLAYVAFQCSVFAEIADEPKQQVNRLFKLGYDNGKRFLEAAARGEISDVEVRTKVPVSMIGAIEGETIDFRLGRIYATASQEAYDFVIKRRNGIDMPIDQWRIDPKLQKIYGGTEFRTRNCSLIK